MQLTQKYKIGKNREMNNAKFWWATGTFTEY